MNCALAKRVTDNAKKENVMKLNALSALFVATLVVACGPVATPPGSSAPIADAAFVPKPDAAPVATPDASVPVADTAPVNTSTATVTATNPANPTNDAGGTVINITVNVGSTDSTTNTATGTNTGTGTKTATATGTNPDAAAVTVVADAKPSVSPDADPPSKLDATVVVEDDAPLACVPNPSGEICGNGLDDNCNGLIDEGCPAPDAGTAPVCSGSETQDCNQTIGSTVYTGKKQCVNGKFTACLNLVPPAPKPDTTDHTSPTVALPVCSMSDTANLPAGLAIPFYADAKDDTNLLACQFYLNANELGVQSVTGTSLTLEQDITLPVGTNTIFVICFDAAGNEGQSVTLTVKAVSVSSDAGVQLKADAQVPADTKPAPDTLVAAIDTQVPTDTTPTPVPDAGTDTLVVADTLPLGDAGSAGCFVLVNNQYMTIPYGQAIVCAIGSLSGSQTCQADGTPSVCTATGTAKSNLRAVVNCRLNQVVLSGDVVDNLFPSPNDTTALTDICLAGDGIDGMIASNRNHCLPYVADSSHQYVFDNLGFGAALYRITYFGVTQQTATTGQVRWSNNNPDLGLAGTNGVPIMANDTSNLCSITRKIIDGDTAKLVVNGTGTPL